MHVEVKDPDEKVILSKLYTSEGRFTFTSHSPGEHVICLYSNSTAWFGGQQLVRRRRHAVWQLNSSFSSSARSFGHWHRRTRHRLSTSQCEREINRTSITRSTIVGPSGTDVRSELRRAIERFLFVFVFQKQRTELSTLSRRTFPSNEWINESTRSLVVDRAITHPRHRWFLANASLERIFRSKETCLTFSMLFRCD